MYTLHFKPLYPYTSLMDIPDVFHLCFGIKNKMTKSTTKKCSQFFLILLFTITLLQLGFLHRDFQALPFTYYHYSDLAFQIAKMATKRPILPILCENDLTSEPYQVNNSIALKTSCKISQYWSVANSPWLLSLIIHFYF